MNKIGRDYFIAGIRKNTLKITLAGALHFLTDFFVARLLDCFDG